MPAAYSLDLRQKVVEAVDRGARKTQVCRMFNISRNTLDLWLKRRAATGSVQAASGYQRGHDPKITDWERFRAFVQQHGDQTQAEMAERWDAQISARSISRALRKLGWTRKKRRTATLNAMR
jgi:transposase